MRLAFTKKWQEKSKKWHEHDKERISMRVYTTAYTVVISDFEGGTVELRRDFVGKPNEETLKKWMRECVDAIQKPIKAVGIENELGRDVYFFSISDLAGWQKRTWLQKHNERVSQERKERAARNFTSN